jgi:membrane-bound lytic murein transglycosylase D
MTTNSHTWSLSPPRRLQSMAMVCALFSTGCALIQPSVSVAPASAPIVVEAAPAKTVVVPKAESKPLPAPPLPPEAVDFWTQISEARRFKDCDYDPNINAWAQRLVGSKERFRVNVERFLPYLDYVWREAQALDMPAEVAYLPLVESDYRQVYGSYGSPGGWWQLMPETARDYGMSTVRGNDQRLDPVLATAAALKLMQANGERFQRDWLLAIFAYNVGGLRIQRALNARGLSPGQIEHVSQLDLPGTTEHHLHRLIAWGCIFADPARYGAELPPGLTKRQQFRVTQTDATIPARAVAAALGGNLGQTWLSQHPLLDKKQRLASGDRFLAPGEFTQLLAKLGDLDKYRQLAAAAPIRETSRETKPVAARTQSAATTSNSSASVAPRPSTARTRVQIDVPEFYAVKSGDSLWIIARRFDMRVKEIIALNPGIDRKTVLRLKQKLRLR